jgi:flagella basal body P-ring formation protein FlgA
LARLFRACRRRAALYSGGVEKSLAPAVPVLLALACALPAGPAAAALDDAVRAEVRAWAGTQDPAESGRAGARVEVEAGQLDPRLRLAPCGKVEAYLPPGSRAWGRTRVGVRCTDGAADWNVYLPVTVRVMAPAWVLRDALPAGTELTPDQLEERDVDWAERNDPPLTDLAALQGQRLARSLPAGHAPRAGDLRRREWFAAGARVRVTAVGQGFKVSTEGRALQRGIDGETVRVRTEAGRIVSGRAVGESLVELDL